MLSFDRLYLASDFHLHPSFHGDVTLKMKTSKHSNDAIILAGDILPSQKLKISMDESSESIRRRIAYTNFFDTVSSDYKYVFVVLGNHDYWGSSLEYAQLEYETYFGRLYQNVFTLSSYSPLEVNDTILVGDTLWTDFDNSNISSMSMWRNTMNDYLYINSSTEFGTVSASRILEEHEDHKRDIFAAADLYHDKKVVVVTHHAPSEKSVSKKYKDHYANSYYFSNLESEIIERKNIVAWAHGHMHSRIKYKIGKNCTVYCNAYGYNEELPTKTWKPVEIII